MSDWLSPAFVLGLLLSIGYASLYHLLWGRGVTELLMALPTAVVGFGAGQLLGLLTKTPVLQIGQLHLLEATLGAWCALLLVRVMQR